MFLLLEVYKQVNVLVPLYKWNQIYFVESYILLINNCYDYQRNGSNG